MTNGYLVAAEADLPVAREIAEGFGLDVISANGIGDHQATAAALATASNVGLLLSETAAREEGFIALLGALATQLNSAQLILATPEARAAFAFLPQHWPAMSLGDARTRASDLLRRRQATESETEPPRAQPMPPGGELEQQQQQEEAAPAPAGDELSAAAPDNDTHDEARIESFDAGVEAEAEPPLTPAAEAPPVAAEPPATIAPQAPPQPAPARKHAEPAPPSAPADATAFAPKKLRRGTPELVRIVIHQPQDLNAVVKAAREIDPRTEPTPQGMPIGDIPLGASVGVSLDVRGAACDGKLQRRSWTGDAADFNFSVEADESVRQAVFLARVFVDDAQIGVLAFTRKISGPAKKPAGMGDRVRLKRHKRVFLSYSSNDRETVSQIATAYQMAGVEHFWDRASLKSGEEWHPRLRREIDRADLFHLCWSKAAAESEWVAKEAEHALTRRRRNSGKPEITVQMLDGPPWAPHPPDLDAINFDDFVRAAIVGYTRGEG